MASRLRSNLCAFILLVFVKLTNLQATEHSASSYAVDISEDSRETVKPYDDFIEIVEAPNYVGHHFEVVVSFRCREFRVITLEIISRGIENRERTEFSFNFVVATQTEETEIRRVVINLRDSIVFRDNRALNITTDLHANNVTIVALILDINPWMKQKGERATVFAVARKELLLVPPWRRPHKPGFCFPWFWKYVQTAQEKKIYQCGPLGDVSSFVNFPVAVTGGEEGFKKFLPHLYWPDKELEEAHRHIIPRFTICTWVYVMELCPNTLCSILHHKNKNLLTPVVSIIQTGHLHIQLHFKDESGFAFLSQHAIQMNTWVQIVLGFADRQIQVVTRYGANLDDGENFLYMHFPRGPFHYSDSDGYWVIGGSAGFSSFKGFIGPTTIYRTRVLHSSQIPLPSKDHPMFTVGLEEHFEHCTIITERLSSKIEEFAIDRLMEESLQQVHNDSCLATQPSPYEYYSFKDTSPAGRNQCDVTLSGETPEVDRVVLDVLSNATINMTSAGERLYQLASRCIVRGPRHVPLALSLLRVSSCIGNVKSLYTAAVIYTTGLGVSQDLRKAWLNLLVGAANDHALSQMSLAYRHLIGADDIPINCDTAAGYYKMAAVTSDRVLQEHHAVHTHSEAVRLDDYDELANHKGRNSDLFQWLSYQALQGLADAQSILGEMHYYGKRGFQRDLKQATKFYQMSAEKGNPEGLFNLGISKLKGHGTNKNETEALELIRKAADQGFAPALNALGFYEVNMRSNYSGGALYFMLATKKGDRDGMFNLGVAHDNGWVGGKPKDKKIAFKFWMQAANKAHPGACVLVGEELRVGEYLDRSCHNSVVYLRFLAEQHPDVGWLLRRALEAYYTGDWYKSLIFYLLAAEAGMEVPQYNTALLCEENPDALVNKTAVDCVWRYYNSSASLGWVFSMMKVGDNHWYGKTVSRDTTEAAVMYAKAAAKNDHPHALYNLAYLVEYNYSLAGIHWTNTDKNSVQRGNLTFAAIMYRKCRDSTSNGNESYLPCAFGLVRVTVKEYYRNHPLQVQVLAAALSVVIVMVTISLTLTDDRPV